MGVFCTRENLSKFLKIHKDAHLDKLGNGRDDFSTRSTKIIWFLRATSQILFTIR